MLDQTGGAPKPDIASNAYYPGIGALRGLAAVLVVVQHGGMFATQAAGVPFTNLLKIDFGALGVLTFFIISGFVIGLNRHLPTGEFLLRRGLRIYPAFWAAYALSAAIVLLADKQTGFSWAALFLWPQTGYPTIHITFWTLVFEVFFYALAAAVFAFRLSDRTLTALALCWMLVIQTMYPYMTGMRPILPGALIPFAQYNLFFAAGLICALNFGRLSRVGIEVLLGFAVVMTALLPLLPPTPHATTLLVLALGLSAILLAVTKIERWPRIDARARQCVVRPVPAALRPDGGRGRVACEFRLFGRLPLAADGADRTGGRRPVRACRIRVSSRRAAPDPALRPAAGWRDGAGAIAAAPTHLVTERSALSKAHHTRHDPALTCTKVKTAGMASSAKPSANSKNMQMRSTGRATSFTLHSSM